MKQILLFLSLFVVALHMAPVMAQQSSITEADGASCMGDDKSKKQTESVALQEAKRMAVEFSKTHVESETVVENFELKQDLVKAFAAADVQVLDILEENWDDPATGDCFNIRIKAEVVPSKAAMAKVDTSQFMNNPRSPLHVRVWTNSDAYSRGEAMKIYVQGNKPFYGRLIYIDADNNQIQLLPNQHRRENYFAGTTTYEVPEARDRFEMTVGEPFGKEKLILYASTGQLGNIKMTEAGEDVYLVTEAPVEVARKTRGISITKPGSSLKKPVVEFAEASADVVTSDAGA